MPENIRQHCKLQCANLGFHLMKVSSAVVGFFGSLPPFELTLKSHWTPILVLVSSVPKISLGNYFKSLKLFDWFDNLGTHAHHLKPAPERSDNYYAKISYSRNSAFFTCKVPN